VSELLFGFDDAKKLFAWRSKWAWMDEFIFLTVEKSFWVLELLRRAKKVRKRVELS